MNYLNTTILTIALFFSIPLSFIHAQCSFGNENPGFTQEANFGANYILGVAYNCPNNMEITSLNLFGLGTNSQVQMAIYADNTGVPGALLAVSDVGVVGNGVISLPITPLNVTAGNYWIMAIYPNDGTGSNHTYYTTSTSEVVYYESITFGNPLPTNASGFMSYSGQDFHYWASGNVFSVDEVTECAASYTWIDGNTYNSDNNSATFTYVAGSAAGCDSTVLLDLTFLSAPTGVDQVTECGSYTWIDGNTYISSNNSATFTIVGGAANGCDSIATLDLTIVPQATGFDQVTECGSYTWIDGNTYISSNNSATFTIVGGAANGCDSIATLDLTIVPQATGVDQITECGSYTWIDGNTYTSSNNSATFTITGGAANGCDSLVTLDLTIDNVSDISTSIDDLTITAENENATYVWLDCENGYAPIPNETNQSFNATMNGVYAVQLTENGCVDTSDCVTINTINTVSNDFKNEIQLFPNPTNKDVTIDLGSAYKNIEIVLLDLTGRKLSETSFTNNDLVNISLANQPTGTYFLQIHADGKRTMLKVVKN